MVAVHCGHVDVPDVHCLRVKVTVDGPIATGAFSGHSFFTTAPDGNWPASLGSAPNQFVLGQERSTTLRCVPSTIFAMSYVRIRSACLPLVVVIRGELATTKATRSRAHQ